MQHPTPSTKLFDLADMKRCPVTISPEAQEYIDASHHQGRMLPQALSEHFGSIEHVESIAIDIAKMQEHLPFHTNPEALALVIIIRHRERDDKSHRFLLNAQDLRDVHPITLQPLIQARTIASTLIGRYPHK